MKRILISLMLLLPLLTCSNNSQTIETVIRQNENVNSSQFVVDQLATHQVVILGESEYNDHLHYQTIIDVLNLWLQSLPNHSELPNKMCLVLEKDQDFIKKLSVFFDQGDPSVLVEYPTSMTVADIEFFYDIKQMLDDIKSNKYGKQVDLQVFGPEMKFSVDFTEAEERAYAENSDAYRLDQFMTKMNALPEHKFLCLFSKQNTFKTTDPETNQDLFAKTLIANNVSTYTFLKTPFRISCFNRYFNQNATEVVLSLRDIDQLPGYDCPFTSEMLDAWINVKQDFFNDILVVMIPSVYTLKKHLDLALANPESRAKSLAAIFYEYTGKNLNPRKELSQQVAQEIETLNTAKAIEDLSLFQNLCQYLDMMNAPDKLYSTFLETLVGFQEKERNSVLTLDDSEVSFWNAYIEQNKMKVRARLLTALLFYGTPFEKKEALASLKRITQKDFDTSKEWINWYRSL